MKQPKPLCLYSFYATAYVKHNHANKRTHNFSYSSQSFISSNSGDTSEGSYTTWCGVTIVCPTHPLVCVLHYAIHRPEEGLDIQSDWIFVSITMDLPQEWSFHSPTNLRSPATPPSPAPEVISPTLHNACLHIATCIEAGIHDVLLEWTTGLTFLPLICL